MPNQPIPRERKVNFSNTNLIPVDKSRVTFQVNVKDEVSAYVDPAEVSGDSVSDAAYSGSWDGVTDVAPSKNAVYDKIETLGTGTGGIIAIQEYRPSPQQTLSTSSNSWSALDTTNLKVAFTCPSTGHVMVRLQAFADSSDNNGKYQWRLTNNSSTQYGWVQTISRDDDGVLAVAFFDVDGLTPGNSYTFYWEHKQNASGTGRVIIYDGTDLSEFGPAYMIVETAP